MQEIDHNIVSQIESIFLPSLKTRRDEVKVQKGRFVHYTSAENAIKIIQSKTLWMRNAKCMNDYMEISHGHQLLVKFFEDDNRRKMFYDALKPCGKEIAQNALDQFDAWWRNIELNTFISAISEHEPAEDKDGRLSMWRAYGQPAAKAAIVLNVPFNPPGATKGLKLILSPVAYYGYEGVERELYTVINNIKKNTNFLVTQGAEIVTSTIFYMLLLASVSLKYEGFKEEKEWRVIYLPNLNASKLISFSIETISGVPQIVYQIPLEDNQTEDVIGVGIPQLVDRIIIGPSVYPFPMYQAFTAALKEAGVKDYDTKVIVSRIPLRT
ncbi:MAG: DUF2971 domain-containing protein [Smithellaceae bacterium]|jgi:hypothetical protein